MIASGPALSHSTERRPLVRPSAFEWLYLVGGLTLVAINVWLIDDAFVYFRYVDNLLFLDNGLVYNQGEYVEGYSSPVWALLLIALRATGLDYLTITQGVALASFALFWWLIVRLNRALGPGSDTLAVNLPLAFLSFNYAVSSHFSSGIETPLLQVVAAACALFIVDPKSRLAGSLLALGPLVRPEFVLPFAVCVAWQVYRSRRIPWTLVLGAGSTLLGWGIFRIYYYADLFPNTFYLKDIVWWGQGWLYFVDTFWPYGVGLYAIAFVAMARWLHGRGVDIQLAARVVMLLCALSVTIYVIKIGGAPRHYRYLAFPFCLSFCAAAGLFERFVSELGPQAFRRFAVAGLGVAALSFAAYPNQLDAHPTLGHPHHVQVDNINEPRAGNYDAAMRELARRSNWEEMRPYREGAPFVHTKVVASSKCRDIYRDFETYFVHSYGLTDALLAHTEMPSDRPAHKKGLKPLARDMARIASAAEAIGPGMYRAAVEAGEAPDWIVHNLDRIEATLAKVYNRHDFRENLALAFHVPPKIQPR